MPATNAKRFAQESDGDVVISQVRHVFENEGVGYAVVQGRRFGAYRWSHRLNVRVSSASRF
jgi:hypothetical protein